MKKTQKPTPFPSEAELKTIRRKYSRGIASRPLQKNATEVERLKHSLCREFVTYANAHDLTNREMSRKVKVNESLMSKILHYHYDEFTVDRLMGYLSALVNGLEVTVKVPAASRL